ncbi:MAG: ABC-F family ATP-binding cassette domain-containing protein [Aeriscardovia sp.]|nr:ABC-F family ATP-binding cassette domain-containing protein [Aeriscardovia sp.]
MSITADDLSISWGARQILYPASFSIGAGEKIGLVGRNGAGKTTFVRTLVGDLPPEGGKVQIRGALGYLPQETRAANQSQTVMERILSAKGLSSLMKKMEEAQKAVEGGENLERDISRLEKLSERFEAEGGWSAKAEASKMASRLEIADYMDAPLSALSGGQKRRVELARIIFAGADTLILDEPTNHLDAGAVEWLTEKLKEFGGALLLISHSQKLLDECANAIWYLHDGVFDKYSLGYSAFLKERAAREERARKAAENAKKQAEKLLKVSASLGAKATKAVAAKNMERRAEKLLEDNRFEAKREKSAAIRLPEPERGGRILAECRGLSYGYGGRPLLEDLNLTVERDSRIAVLGANGAGKTTFLRLLSGQLPPGDGEAALGEKCRVGYFSQEHENLDGERTVLENMMASCPKMSEEEARTALGGFLFSSDEVYKRAGVLSGGEKTRLSLASLAYSGANLLLLDEPTNNLDPASREKILEAISGYKGACILVTHDRGALEALRPDRILLLPDGVEDRWEDGYLDLVAEE